MNKISVARFCELIRPFLTDKTSAKARVSASGGKAEFKNLTTCLQEGTQDDIVFYKISEEKKEAAILKERLKKSNYGILVISTLPMLSVFFDFLAKKENIFQIEEKDFLPLQKKLSDELYPMIDSKIKLVGITGTNGKTTVTSLAMQVSSLIGKKAISVGTLGIDSSEGKLEHDRGMTTPSYVEVRKIIHRYQNNYQAIFFEASSHGLKQNRLYQIKFDVAGWTNFTQDHLDYHADMEDYFQSKVKIAKENLKEGAKLIFSRGQEKLFLKVKNNQLESQLEVQLEGREDLKLKMAQSLKNFGLRNRGSTSLYQVSFNKSNLELALEINRELWGNHPESDKIGEIDLAEIQMPRGRFSLLNMGKKVIIIDYAHTPDALKNILQATSKSFKNKKIRLVFGCGGDRDLLKRPLMGKIAGQYADKIYLTSDNPRQEDPDKIIEDIKAGIIGHENIYTNKDRKQSIRQALKEMEEGDILLISGKGHEEYQEIGEKKIPFSDFQVVKEFKQAF